MTMERNKVNQESSESNTSMDEDQYDSEVASVLSKAGNKGAANRFTSPMKRLSTPGRFYSPFRPSTVMTNVSRGNTKTTTPCIPTTLTNHQLAAQGELVLLKPFIDSSNVNEKDEYGITMLMWACANDQVDTVKFLLALGALTEDPGKGDSTPLMIACCHGYERIATCLLDNRAEINTVCEKGNSALMYAVYKNNTSCVGQLLDWGADMTLTNLEGYNAMELAIKLGHKESQRVMEEHMLKLLDPT